MKIISFLFAFALVLVVNGQTKNTKTYSRSAALNFSDVKEDWKTRVQSFEAPSPGGDSYRSFLLRKKAEIGSKREAGEKQTVNSAVLGTGDNPIVNRVFQANPFAGGLPNDNSVAISNDGTIISCVNSSIYIFDREGNELESNSLQVFGDALGLSAHKFDPKVKYDPEMDKFILVYLSGSSDTTNNIVVAFSESNDPTGNWNLYSLEGNPLNNGTWSDYPALALSKNDFFITLNLLITGESWQTGFDGTIIWQIDKESGYTGGDLESDIWTGITHEGSYIRNMHPVQGGSGLRDSMFFVSNRNFDETNDTVFFVSLFGHQGDVNSELTVNPLISNTPYGMPPQGRQLYSHRLSTNDARCLGAYWEGSRIEFVSNSMNHENGSSSVFHGVIEDIENPTVDGRILSDSTDFGYPNIAYSGKYAGDKESIINFNYVHPDIYSSCAVIYFDGNTGNYSEKITLKEGETYVNMMGGDDRWGDYSGIQRIYNEPGKVVCTGTYGAEFNVSSQNRNGNLTIIAELTSPDSTQLNPPATEFNLKIGPNPSQDLVNIFFDIPESGSASIKIYDSSGRIVKVLFEDQVKEGANLLIFSSDPLEEGLYFIHFIVDGETIKTEKLVKQ